MNPATSAEIARPRLEKPGDDPNAAASPPMLPRYPLPELDSTLAAYARCVQPLLQERPETVLRDISRFLDGDGAVLQRTLSDRQESSSIGVIPEVRRRTYLSERNRLPLGSCFAAQSTVIYDPSLRIAAAAGVLAGARRFERNVRDGSLEPDVENEAALCMDPYFHVLGTTRLPDQVCDRIRTTENAGHSLVAHAGNLWKVWTRYDGHDLPAGAIEHQIRHIVEAQVPQQPAIGALTSLQREQWADLRTKIGASSPINAISLEEIESAQMLVALEFDPPSTVSARAQRVLFDDLHNRWFDKGYQVVVNGMTLGVIAEHSMYDGLALARASTEILVNAMEFTYGSRDGHAEAPEPVLLRWELSPELRTAVEREIERARAPLACTTTSVELPFGKGDLGDHSGMSAECLIQLSLQTGFLSLTGRIPSQNEPIHMRHYRYGRTEGHRSATRETADLARQLLDSQLDVAMLGSAMERAAAAHRRTIATVKRGNGGERHLEALCFLAKDTGIGTWFFDSPHYQRYNRHDVSTSAMNTDVVESNSFAPVPVSPQGEPGFAVIYQILANSLRLTVTSEDEATAQRLLETPMAILERVGAARAL